MKSSPGESEKPLGRPRTDTDRRHSSPEVFISGRGMTTPRKTPKSPLAQEDEGETDRRERRQAESASLVGAAQGSAGGGTAAAGGGTAAAGGWAAGGGRAGTEMEVEEYEVTPAYAYVLCTLAFFFILCFSFAFLLIKKKVRRAVAVPAGEVPDPQRQEQTQMQKQKSASSLRATGSGSSQAAGGAGAGGHSENKTPNGSPSALPPLRPAAMSGEPRMQSSKTTSTLLTPARPVKQERPASTSAVMVKGSPNSSPTHGNGVVMFGDRVVLPASHPSLEMSLRPRASPGQANSAVKFYNRSEEDVLLYRITSDGTREALGTIRKARAVELETPPGQPFVITSLNGSSLTVFVAQANKAVAFVD